MSVVKDFLGDVVRESAGRLLDEEFTKGYNEAANICTRVLSNKIDGLLSQVKTGRYLSEHEQFLLSSLDEIKSEIEAALREF